MSLGTTSETGGLPGLGFPRLRAADTQTFCERLAAEAGVLLVVAAGEDPLVPDAGTAADWLPGIRDEHDDEGGWQAAWLDRPTWDRRVTPNVIRRTGTRPRRRR